LNTFPFKLSSVKFFLIPHRLVATGKEKELKKNQTKPPVDVEALISPTASAGGESAKDLQRVRDEASLPYLPLIPSEEFQTSLPPLLHLLF